MLTRREFLRHCSLAAGVVSLNPVSLLAQNRAIRTGPTMPGLDQFKSQLNTSFTVQTGQNVATLVLVEAKPFSASATGSLVARNEKFSLLFRGPVTLRLEQGIHPLEHTELGNLLIFIVPIGCRDTNHIYYEAIFNRPGHAEDWAQQLALAPRRGQMMS